MRKLLKCLFVVAVFVLICAPCTLVNTPPPTKDVHNCDFDSCAFPEDPAPPARAIYSQEDWQFSVPGKAWIKSLPSIPQMKLSITNENHDCLILFLKEETSRSYSKYVTDSIGSFIDGGNYVGTINQVVINGNKFVEFQVDNDDE